MWCVVVARYTHLTAVPQLVCNDFNSDESVVYSLVAYVHYIAGPNMWERNV